MTEQPADPTCIAVAFCPSAPLLVPAVAGRAAEDTAVLRTACVEAVAALLDRSPGVVVVTGAGTAAGVRYGPGDGGTLRGFGVDVDVPFCGPVAPGGRRTPLAHTLGAWLLDRAGWDGSRLGVAPEDLAAALAEATDGGGGSVGVLVVGDGSARRTLKAPGYLDDAAAPFDSAVAAALAGGNAAGLAALSAAEGDRLLAAGTGAWRAVGRVLTGRPVDARLRYDAAPYGVGYLVADWVAR